METAIGKAIDLVLQYTVVPIARQFKYLCCYKSCVAEMNEAVVKLGNDKEIVDVKKAAAENGGQLIHKKTDAWLAEVASTQDEVRGLLAYQESKKAMMIGCSSVGSGHIVNPIARHKLGRKATKKKQAIADLRKERPQLDQEISYSPPPRAIAGPKPQINDGVFRSSRWEEINEEIMTALQDDRTNVIGLYGMGGVGKSTMINEVYDQVKKQCRFDVVIKVEVKVKPEIRRIQGDIAFQLGLKFESDWSPSIRADLLRERLLKTEEKSVMLKEGLQKTEKKKKSVLIILDDLWVKLDLQEVGIPLDGNDQVNIKLLLTSRHEYLLSDTMGAHNPIHLDVLNDADAMRMFNFFVGTGGTKVVDEDRVIEATRKCSGLPIVIEATSKALKNRALGEWEKILKRLDNVDVLEKLKVSYDYLPSKESKSLFLLCGISRGPNIQVRDLLKYSFGLRLFNRKDSSSLVAAAAKLEILLSGLEAASMLLKSDDSRYVKIHDRMRELAVKIVAEDRPEWAHDVTLVDNSYCELLPDASELNLLLSCWEGDAVELGDSFLKDMKKLNVLECRNLCVALTLPSSSTIQLGHLRNLGTLCLHNCVLGDISMIGELKGLQILSFMGSDICKLSIQLGGLTALKMLDLSDCAKLAQIEPNVLGSLTKLEELNMENSFQDWEIEQEDGAPPSNAKLTELKNMSRLCNVRICIPSTSMLPKDGQLFSSKLTMYHIMFGVARKGDQRMSDNYDSFCVYGYEYNNFSRVLMLRFDSPDTIWQDWVQTTLQTAEVLYVTGCLDGKCESIDKMCINGFECLKHLRLRDCRSLRFIISLNGGFCTDLEALYLQQMESIESLCGELPRHEKDEVFSNLRVLKASDCNKLTHLFDFSLLNNRLSSKLEDITVARCAEVQYIVAGECDSNYEVVTLSSLHKLEFIQVPKFSSFYHAGPSSNVLFTGKKVAFPCLQSLEVVELDELEHIWHPTDPPAELGNLRSLHVDGCNKLVRVINSNVLMRLQQDLESLIISECELMKQVFDVDDAIISSCTDEHLVLFSCLKELKLERMIELEGVYSNNTNMMMMKGGRSMTIFPNIGSLDVSHCPHLRYLLCCSLPTTTGNGVEGGGGYENLNKIQIGYCEEMEVIVVVMLRILADQETQKTDTTRDQENVLLSNSETCSRDTTINSASSSIAKMVLFRRVKTLSLYKIESLKSIYTLSSRDDRPILTMFPDVELLEVSHCNLRYLLSWSMPPRSVGAVCVHLTEINIENCDQMEAIVIMSGTMVDQETQPGDANHRWKYDALKVMDISNCCQLRSFCHYPGEQDSAAANDLPFFSQKEIFPRLEELTFYCLSKLGKIWPHDQVPPQSSFEMVNNVSIMYCPELSVVFPSTLIPRLNNLADVTVQHCDHMRQIIIVEEKKGKRCHAVVHGGSGCSTNVGMTTETEMEMTFTFPRLRKLCITDLPKLDRFYSSSSSSSSCSFQFPCLETLKIERCCGVKSLFNQRRPTTTGLVDGVDHDPDSDMVGALFRSCDMLAIPNLKVLKLLGLKNLTEYVLTPLQATSFVHLTSLTIKDCKRIRAVVAVEEVAAASNEDQGDHHTCREITFRYLKYLILEDLPRLEKFSSVNNKVLNFPSLEDLDIRNCPKMKTFSSGIATGSTPQFGDLNSCVLGILQRDIVYYFYTGSDTDETE